MRHRVYGKHLGRDKDERDNLFKGLVQALLTHGTIQTTATRAKAIKGLVDKTIRSTKKNPKLGTKTSGYTRIIKIGPRLGDQTMMVKMSLIGAEEIKPTEKEPRIKKQELSKKGVKKLNS